MTVQRPTDPELVVQNSTLWLSAVFGLIGVILLAAAFSSGDKRLAGPASVTAVFALLSFSKIHVCLRLNLKNGSLADHALRDQGGGQHAVRRRQGRGAPERTWQIRTPYVSFGNAYGEWTDAAVQWLWRYQRPVPGTAIPDSKASEARADSCRNGPCQGPLLQIWLLQYERCWLRDARSMPSSC